jgi:hypothetical protein
VSWQKFKPWLVMGLIFLVGVITGGALMFGFRPDLSHPPGPQQIRNHWLMHLTERLQLTPDQQAKIQPILEDAGAEIQKHHRDELEQISQIMQAANDKITPLLTAAQQAEMKQMEAERKGDFQRHMRPWNSTHDHHGPDGETPGP